jgi:alpha-methylacyl-CoA racemase
LLAVTGLANRLDPADQYRKDSWPAMAQAFSERFRERRRDDWAAAAAERDCCLSPVLDFAEAAAHPHLIANQWFAAGEFAQPGAVIRFDDHPGLRPGSGSDDRPGGGI